MDAGFLSDWTRALRSGEYEQGAGSLYDYYNGYCCMGVACSMKGIGEDALYDMGTISELLRYNPRFNNLGFPDIFSQHDDPDSMLVDILVSLNDGLSESMMDFYLQHYDNLEFLPGPYLRNRLDHRYTFVEIADWLDHNVQPV